MEEKKTCTKCRKIKSLANFYHSKTEQRYSSWCKQCFLTYYKQYYNKNKSRLCVGRYKNIEKAKKRWVANGRCITCGKPKLKNSRFCEIHYVRSAMRYALGHAKKDTAKILLSKFKKNPKCPYTGEPLILGLNAHLDHILPRSRYPDFITSLENLEWVSAVGNHAKGSMTKEEFLSQYKIIYIG